MTGQRYRAALEALELTHREAAKLMGIGLRSSLRYASSPRVPKLIGLAVEGLLSRQVKMRSKPR